MCPTSSIIRNLYYDRCHGITRLPRVVIGTPDSWDPTISFASKDGYKFCTWSPCGRFVAAQTKETVEIRNQLTFELLTILRSTRDNSLLTGPLSYSPDGRSIACGSSNTIVIWDILTGGITKEIEHTMGGASLAWSSDGETIAIICGSHPASSSVVTYDVVSGEPLTVQKPRHGGFRNLWSCEKSFRFVETSFFASDKRLNISISEIGPPFITTETLDVTMRNTQSFPVVAFSPSTHRVSILGFDTLRILDIRNSNCFLEEGGNFTSPQFSPDGDLFAASHWDCFRVWKFTSGGYLPWGKYQFQYPLFSPHDRPSLQFSPTSPSIMSQYRNVLQVRRLQGPIASPKTRGQHTAISPSGRLIATVHESKSTVMIIDTLSQTPSQFIDTDMEILELVITGNVLLVVSSREIVAWLLTEEGTVEGLFDNENAGRSHSIWTISPPPGSQASHWGFLVDGKVGIINTCSLFPFTYHVETGVPLDRYFEPKHLSRSCVTFYQLCDSREYYYLRYPDLPAHDTPTEDPGSKFLATMQETGWVIDPEGRHKFWIPVEWRKSWKRENWHHDITTLFNRIGDQPVVIKL